MYKLLLGGAAVAALFAMVPANAQPVPPAAPVAPQAQMPMQRMPMRVQTRDEVVQHVRELFARLDTNRDGFLTREEADAAKQKMAGEMRTRFAQRLAEPGRAMPDRGAMFDRLDTNKDGTISRQEFVSAQPQIQERRVIMMRDGGEPGKMRMHGMGMGGMHGRMFESADANRDGRVSLQEMTNAALQRFDSADANHDGKLTPEERMQMHQQRKTQRMRPA
ncbi:MAG: EF-hand domain-containing protein [Sphingomonas sp.]